MIAKYLEYRVIEKEDKKIESSSPEAISTGKLGCLFYVIAFIIHFVITTFIYLQMEPGRSSVFLASLAAFIVTVPLWIIARSLSGD